MRLMKMSFFSLDKFDLQMFYYNRINLSEGNNPVKISNSKECMVCDYCFFNHGFTCQDYICNCFHDLFMQCVNVSDIAIITVIGVDYCCITHDITKSAAIHLIKKNCTWWSWVYIKYMRKKSMLKIKCRIIILTIWSKQKNRI